MVHLVKTGLMGLVGRFRAVDMKSYPRSHKVICRTERGLEYGEVVCKVDSPEQVPTDGELLRSVNDNDELILNRLQRYRDRAFIACEEMLRDKGFDAILVDVEHLFDGQSLFFYFLGDVDPELEQLTGQLAERYEAKVRFKKFAETLSQGCGPDCGTKEGGCSSGGCSGCSLSGKCGPKSSG